MLNDNIFSCLFICILLCVGQTRSGVYTIDVRTGAPTNFTNSGYVSTEGTVKAQSNDGLPTYEEAISGVKTPSAPPSSLQPSIELVNEDSQNGGGSSRSGGRRHRRHHRHRHHSDQQNNENAESNAPDDSRRHRHRRGFRLKRHLAKINRRNHGETE